MEPKLIARLLILTLTKLTEKFGTGWMGDDAIAAEVRSLAQTYAEACRLASPRGESGSLEKPDLGAVPYHTTSRGEAALERADAAAEKES